ncbi:hypothetical protein [Streptomyces sp. NPDC046821]|uniref:hypothetical protein n=1 Tax=Streptomyces sp. NPDC046821 TaxID=3154702 RepID=UPI0033CE2F97
MANCDDIKGPAHDYCVRGNGNGPPDFNPGPDGNSAGGQSPSENLRDFADYLIKKIEHLVAPDQTWAPKSADSAIFSPFLWLGQHLAIAIFTCVVVVCALSAWQGAPRLRQMGYSTGWTLAATIGMASVPGFVFGLNRAVSQAFKIAFDSNEGTLFGTIKRDMVKGADSGNPLAIVLIMGVLCVAIAVAMLVYLTRNPAILAFVCISPLVLASLAREGDVQAVQAWAQRLLGIIFAPLILLMASPFVAAFKGSLIMDAVILAAADFLMLRMIFHGIPYFGPRMARGARRMVENHTPSPMLHMAARAAVPDFHEQENAPRGPRHVSTPGRAIAKDSDVLFASYGLKRRPRPGRLTTDSVISQINTDSARTQQLTAARRQARASQLGGPSRTPTTSPTPTPSSPTSSRSGGAGGQATP